MAKIFKLSDAISTTDLVVEKTERGLTVTYVALGHYNKLDFDQPIDAIDPKALEGVTADDFHFHENIKYAIIPEGIKTISENAFSGYANLKEVVLNPGLKTIKNDAFAYCTALTTVTMGDNVEDIGQFAFVACHNLKNIFEFNKRYNYGKTCYEY